ncbi:ion channel [Solidesulfovibrio sp. C21]|uniref:ion channel n=1 Tax=Solidesulfovibrio sp. C21 TaxID=3398613 RepID=UPI0039FC40F4
MDKTGRNWLASLSVSFATFSKPGFGDTYPVKSTARIWTMAEVMIGYIMLGDLISILANKRANRAKLLAVFCFI